MNAAATISKSQRVASTICSSRMNQAYLAITAARRYATSSRSQIRSVGFSSMRDGRYLMLGFSCMEDSLSQMEVAEDQKSEQRDATHCDHPPLRVPSFLLERISRVEECVSQ